MVGKKLYLEGQAVVCGGLVFAAVVLAIVHVNMVQLQEAHQVSGGLHRHTMMIAVKDQCRIKIVCGPQYQNKELKHFWRFTFLLTTCKSLLSIYVLNIIFGARLLCLSGVILNVL